MGGEECQKGEGWYHDPEQWRTLVGFPHGPWIVPVVSDRKQEDEEGQE